MTLVISGEEYDSLWQQNSPNHYNLILDDDELIAEAPKSLGQQGYIRSIELFSGVWLDFINWKCTRDLIIKSSVHEHEIQFLILTSGHIYHDEIYPTLDKKQAYISGSGISPLHRIKHLQSEYFRGIDIHIEPEVIDSFFPNFKDGHSAFTKLFLRQNEWKESFFPQVTPSMRALVKQMLNAPYRGIARKLYLQAKVLELLAMQLNPIMAEFDPVTAKSKLKSQTIDRIYQARDILLNRLENPPSILELTQQVGICDRTLRRGFRELFGTTVIGYLNQKRMEQAEQLLREGELSISEIANLVGYSNLSYFAAAFKGQFGITPSDCLGGRKINSK